MKTLVYVLASLATPAAWAGFTYCVGAAERSPDVVYVSKLVYILNRPMDTVAVQFRTKMFDLGLAVARVRCVDGQASSFLDASSRRAENIVELEGAGRRVIESPAFLPGQH